MIKNLLALFAMFFCLTSLAAKMPTLYQAEFPIHSHEEDARLAAVKKGLAEVLTRLSAASQLEKNSAILEALQHADDYVQEFHYVNSAKATPVSIQINYDETEINQLLKKAAIPLLPEFRPQILVWLSLSRPKQELEIMSNETGDPLLNVFREQAARQRLPLIFPMMDIADISQVMPSDVKGMEVSLLKEAGKRYSANVLLIGYIEATEDGYQSNWKLVANDQQWNFKVAEKADDKLIGNLLLQLNQTLAQVDLSKIFDTKERAVKLNVANISKQEDLAQLMKHLKQLAAVDQIELAKIAKDQVDVNLVVHGPVTAFAEDAAKDKRLVLRSQDKKNHQLNYEWVR